MVRYLKIMSEHLLFILNSFYAKLFVSNSIVCHCFIKQLRIDRRYFQSRSMGWRVGRGRDYSIDRIPGGQIIRKKVRKMQATVSIMNIHNRNSKLIEMK